MEIKFKKAHQDVITPKFATSGAAAMDLVASSFRQPSPGVLEYGTGLFLEIPKGYAGLIFPRSSISTMSQTMSNCVGVIDSDYRGEIKLRFDGPATNVDRPSFYRIGDRIGQLMIVPAVCFELVEGTLSVTERGDGGFGSTGQ